MLLISLSLSLFLLLYASFLVLVPCSSRLPLRRVSLSFFDRSLSGKQAFSPPPPSPRRSLSLWQLAQYLLYFIAFSIYLSSSSFTFKLCVVTFSFFLEEQWQRLKLLFSRLMDRAEREGEMEREALIWEREGM